jgi:glycosyltransferase involved in cell wall biosynthesis
MKRILVLTASHLCRNPRVVKEATALGQAGYDVTVLTLLTHAGFEETDRALAAGLPFRRVALDQRGFWPRLRVRLARELQRRFGRESPWALGPAGPLLRAARPHPADLLIAHTELPLWIATRLHGEGRRVAADFEDWHSEDLMPEDRAARPLRLLGETERALLRHAAFTSTTSHTLADSLAKEFNATRPIVIRNVFPLPPVSRADFPAATEPRFLWFSQTVGPGRGLEEFISAWRLCRAPSSLHLLGGMREGYWERLLAPLSGSQRERVHHVPLVAPDELPGRIARFDIGLALEPATPRNKDLTISNKVFHYLSSGLAVVATATTGQREALAAAPGCGLLLSEAGPEQRARELDALLADPARLRAMQLAARAAAERELCWEKEQARMLEAVARALAA